MELGKLTYLVGQGNLRLDDVWQSNDGVYVCAASNDRGDVVTAQAQLTVLGNGLCKVQKFPKIRVYYGSARVAASVTRNFVFNIVPK